MNDSVKKLIVFISVSIVIGLLFILFSGGGKPPIITKSGSVTVEEFKLKCDSLRAKKWNKPKYKELYSLLVAMESEKIFTTSGAASLEEYLNLAYAKTLKDSYKSWLESGGNDGDEQLFSEMVILAGKPECSKILSNEVQIMRAYFSALQIPQKIRIFTQSEYTLDRYNSLIAEINSTANKPEFISFSSMQTIASDSFNELENFAEFVSEFDYAYNYYINKTDIDALPELAKFCSDKYPTKKYSFYLQKLLDVASNICN
jgi:hypothetical protein